jgi:hypothetical protein
VYSRGGSRIFAICIGWRDRRGRVMVFARSDPRMAVRLNQSSSASEAAVRVDRDAGTAAIADGLCCAGVSTIERVELA